MAPSKLHSSRNQVNGDLPLVIFCSLARDRQSTASTDLLTNRLVVYTKQYKIKQYVDMARWRYAKVNLKYS